MKNWEKNQIVIWTAIYQTIKVNEQTIQTSLYYQTAVLLSNHFFKILAECISSLGIIIVNII